ncbi:hypothetical protein [Leeia aquatica]|uniref:SGNH/GDSL hydrolase family protein n=1 Tax=Leeia aquatica TaxID=2725557 RepID=A0A847S817_9NEIS|nr:hypothetical protein [Leeia aquatica]NLR73776.1 hypothetical protein [Leeia aquatica]
MAETARFLLVGDSHAGAIGRAAQAAEVPFVGGPVGAGRDFIGRFHERCGEEIRWLHAGVAAYMDEFQRTLGGGPLGKLTTPVVSTIGFGAHFFAIHESWRIYQDRQQQYSPAFLAGPLFSKLIGVMAQDALALYRDLHDMGLRVLAVMPPQRVLETADPTIFFAAQEALKQHLQAIGIEVIDVRPEAAGPDGYQRPEYCEPNDTLHGNQAFGALILNALHQAGVGVMHESQ